MPRPSSPWWWKQKNCWAVTIARKRYMAPKEYGQFAKPALKGVPVKILEWHRELVDRLTIKEVKPGDLSVSELANLYLKWVRTQVELGEMSKGTLRGLRTKLGRFCNYAPSEREPVFGRRRAHAITVDELDEAVTTWKKKYATWYVRGLVRAIQGVYSWAARAVPGREPKKIYATNPLAGYKPPVPEKTANRYLERKVGRRFMRWAWARALRGKHEAKKRTGEASRRFDRIFILMFRFIALTGCRPKEACVAKWLGVQWNERVLLVEEWKNRRKTGALRVIPLTHSAVRILRAIEKLPGRHPEHIFTHQLGRHWRKRGQGEHGILAGEPWPDGTAMGGRVRKLRNEAIEEAKRLKASKRPTGGLELLIGEGPRRLVAYILRHTVASDAIMSGLSTSQVADMLGTSPEVVHGHYGHIQPESRQSFADMLEVWRRSQKG